MRPQIIAAIIGAIALVVLSALVEDRVRIGRFMTDTSTTLARIEQKLDDHMLQHR